MFVRNVRPLWVRGSQKAFEWGKPESDFIGFQDLAGSGLPSRLARNFAHLVLRTSSESRLTSPHAARYSTRFDYTVRLRMLRCLMASRRAGVDHGLVFLPGFDFSTCFAAAEIMALLRRRMRRRRFISCTSKERTDSSTASENACQLTSLVFHLALLCGSGATGVWQRSSIVMGRWSEPRSSPTVHSALSAKDGWAKHTSWELRPSVARLSNVAVNSLRTLAELAMTQSSSCSPRASLSWLVSHKGESH